MERQEELMIQKRLLDLSRMADRKGITTFSNFLNLNELNLFHQVSADMQTSYQLSGGYEFAERQMIAFIPDALYYSDKQPEPAFPIAVLRFFPLHLKFAEDLSHRDVLGALMHLGVERSRIGDIKIEGQNYIIFCEEGIAEYLLDSLGQIRHTMITGERAVSGSYQIEQKFEQIEGIIASNRLDSIVAFLTGKSRSQSVRMIQSQKVFVNEAVRLENAFECREGDIISIRGFGKYIYKGSGGETKKGRLKIQLKKYV